MLAKISKYIKSRAAVASLSPHKTDDLMAPLGTDVRVSPECEAGDCRPLQQWEPALDLASVELSSAWSAHLTVPAPGNLSTKVGPVSEGPQCRDYVCTND